MLGVRARLGLSITQTPQAGEFATLAMVAQNLGGPAVGHSGCSNGVDAFNTPLATRLSYKKVHAGSTIIVHSVCLSSVRKVKANVRESADLTP